MRAATLLSIALLLTSSIAPARAGTEDWALAGLPAPGVPMPRDGRGLLEALARTYGLAPPAKAGPRLALTSRDEPGDRILIFGRARVIKARTVRVGGVRVFLYSALDDPMARRVRALAIEGEDLAWLWDQVQATQPLAPGAQAALDAFRARLEADATEGERRHALPLFRRGLYPHLHALPAGSPAVVRFREDVQNLDLGSFWSWTDAGDGRIMADRALTLLHGLVEAEPPALDEAAAAPAAPAPQGGIFGL